jgi:hypothetical protein
VQVRLHELKHDIDVLEVAGRRRQHDVLDLDNVGVAQQAQQLNLAQDARRVCGGGIPERGSVVQDCTSHEVLRLALLQQTHIVTRLLAST